MRIALVAADFEENLGLGMIAAVAEAAGHHVDVLAFNASDEGPALARRIASEEPDVLGLSIQFQHRAHEFLRLARAARGSGFAGHITCGGQFPTLAWQECLNSDYGLDSVVLHEGERAFPELLEALARGRRLADVPGLAVRGDDGAPLRTEPRSLVDLDALPFPKRYRPHARHLGVPFVPVMGSRGCWGRCTYCSITSFYRDAREYGGGATLRMRSPESLATEMALLWHAAGGAGIFCFHDDNFLLPRPADTLARLRAIRTALDEYGVGRIGLVGKCRPETLTPQLARDLAELGVMRLYVGVENTSERGSLHLGRARQTPAASAALSACRDAGIFVCYNLLLFEPEATLEDVRANVGFIREHADHPVNFCRAEPYYGTPMHAALATSGNLGGSYLGFNYRIADDRAELLFRVCAAAFRERNFAPDGVANRTMGLGYQAKVLERFYPDRVGRSQQIARQATALTRRISIETADMLEEAITLVERCAPDDRERIERGTGLLGMRVAAADRLSHLHLDEVLEALARAAEDAQLPPRRTWPTARIIDVAKRAALGASLAAWAVGIDGCSCGEVVDPAPDDGGRTDQMVVDPPPQDAGMDSGMVLDPLPEDAGMDGPMMVDPPPQDAGRDVFIPPVDPAPSDAGIASATPQGTERDNRLVDHWRDTTPRRASRSADLPLHDPPDVRLVGERDGDRVTVRLLDAPAEAGIRWEALGEVTGNGAEVRWTPAGPEDQIRVGVRTRGGIAVVSLRASQLGGWPEA